MLLLIIELRRQLYRPSLFRHTVFFASGKRQSGDFGFFRWRDAAPCSPRFRLSLAGCNPLRSSRAAFALSRLHHICCALCLHLFSNSVSQIDAATCRMERALMRGLQKKRHLRRTNGPLAQLAMRRNLQPRPDSMKVLTKGLERGSTGRPGFPCMLSKLDQQTVLSAA